MKKVFLFLLNLVFLSSFDQLYAQNEKSNIEKSTETNEIIIRRDGGKETKITVQIDGDNIMINGKPLLEFNEDGVKILKRKMMISDGSPFLFDGDLDENGNFSTIEEKTDSTAFLGVSTEKSEKGAKVLSVTKESSAEKAGIQENDVITKLNDQKITDPESLYKAVTSNKPNDEVKIIFLREGKEKKTKAILQLKKQTERKVIVMKNGFRRRNMNPPGFPPPPGGGEDVGPMDGMGRPDFGDRPFGGFRPFPPKQKLGVKIQDTEEGNGVKIIDVAENSVAEKAGIQKGDIVTEISGEKISNTDDIREMLNDNDEMSTLQVKIIRAGKEMNFEIKPPKKLKTMSL